MTDNNGWPDPARPGVPANPERDGWHWVVAADLSVSTKSAPWWWSSANRHWLPPVSVSGAAPLVPARVRWRYLGPCLTPAEVAAAVQAEREACEQAACDASDPPGVRTEFEAQIANDAREMVMDAIRARGPADALAEALAQALREGMTDAERATLAGLRDGSLVAVPREPTEVMIGYGGASHDHPSVFMGGPSHNGRNKARRIWAAMLAAAQEPGHE